MKMRKTTRPVHAPASRWAAWAAQLMTRSGRRHVASRVPLPLYVRSCRVPLTLYRQRLSFHTLVTPRINLFVAGQEVRHSAPPDVYAPQVIFLRSFAPPARRPPAPETRRGTRRVFEARRRSDLRPPPPAPFAAAGARHVALALALTRTRSEQYSSTLHRHFAARQEAVLNQISRRLTQRVRRVDEEAQARPALALRREPPSAATPKPPHAGAPAEQGSFERRGVAHAGPAAAAAVAEVNVEQLAAQVLKHIDRRVIARRERMGQA